MVSNLSERGVHRYIPTAFLLLLNLFPNFKYFVLGDNYLVSYIPYIAILYLMAILFNLFWVCLRIKARAELIRLIILTVSLYTMYFMLLKMHRTFTWFNQKVHWYFIVFVLYQTIYLQIGNELKITSKQTNIKTQIMKNLFYYGLFCL